MSGGFVLQVVGELAPGLIGQEARDLALTLVRVGLASEPKRSSAAPGERGVISTIGALIVEKGPAAGKALLDGFTRYFTRERSVAIDVTRPDGAKIRIEAKNVHSDEVSRFFAAAQDSLG